MRTRDLGHDESHLISWHVGFHLELAYSSLECRCVYYCVNMTLHVHLGGEWSLYEFFSIGRNSPFIGPPFQV